MEDRSLIIVASWIAITVISVVYIWVGGVNTWTMIAVGLLVLSVIILTFAVGGEIGREEKHRLRGEAELRIEFLAELKKIRSDIDALGKELADIKKAIEE